VICANTNDTVNVARTQQIENRNNREKIVEIEELMFY
jgi:hypothetical protein